MNKKPQPHMRRRRLRVFTLAFLPFLGLATTASADRLDELASQVGQLRAQVAAFRGMLSDREARLEGLRRELKELSDEVGVLRTAPPFPVSGPFLAAPSLPSDAVGVAKVAVFAPRIEVDSTRRHDLLFLKIRRVESDSVRVVGDTELAQDQNGVELPIDKSGALYVVEWSTSEGHSYNLLLKDGASGQTAAVVQVKPLQARGRFLLVGYRLE